MKKYLVLVLLILPSCVGAQTQALNNQYQTKFRAEIAAWQKVQEDFPKRCAGGSTDFPPPKAKAVAYTKCNSVLVNEMVMPVATYPDLVMAMRAKALRNAGLFADGKITATEWDARGQENFSAYLKEADSRYYATINQSLRQEQMAAQQTQQALQNMALINTVQNQSSYSAPIGSCRFNPSTGRNQQCFHILTDGSCAHFGEGC